MRHKGLVGRTSGGVGTNQYQVRGHAMAQVPAPVLDLCQPPLGERMARAKNRQASADDLGAALSDSSMSVRAAALQHPRCPPQALWAASEQHDHIGKIATAIARNPVAPAELLHRLSTKADADLAAVLVANINTPLSDWPALVAKSPQALRRAIIAPNCPASILAMGAQDDRIEVRRQVASHGHTAPQTLDSMARNAWAHSGSDKIPFEVKATDNLYIVCSVAHNPNTPSDTLEDIRQWATPGWRRGYGATSPSLARQNVARNPNASVDTLRRLAANKPNADLRGCLGANPNTPPEILAELALDSVVLVRRSTAANPHTPPEQLIQLLTKSKDAQVRHALLRNPAMPDHIRAVASLGR